MERSVGKLLYQSLTGFYFYIDDFIFTVSMIQLYMLMGWAMFGGLAVVIVATITNAWLGRLQQRLQKQILAFKATRVKILNEIISGIKVCSLSYNYSSIPLDNSFCFACIHHIFWCHPAHMTDTRAATASVLALDKTCWSGRISESQNYHLSS